nr:hypothetical protein [Tanacetum cinerariifolium]
MIYNFWGEKHALFLHLDSPEQAPPSPDYVHGPEYLDYLASSDDEIPEDHKENPTDYPADGGDDDEEESSEDDDEKENLAPADSTLPAIDFVPSTIVPLSMTGLRKARKTVRPQPPRAASTEAIIVESDVLEADMPFQKRLCLTSPAPRFKVEESSKAAAARQTRLDFTYGTDYKFIDTLDASIRDTEERALTTLKEVDERVTYISTTLRQETKDIYVWNEDAQDDRDLLRSQINMLRRDRRYFSSMSFAFEREAMYARGAWSCSKDRNTALEDLIRAQEARIIALDAQIMTLQTQNGRIE